MSSHEAGDGVQITHLSLGVHTGTHLDAPRHFIAGGGLVTGLDLHALVGPAHVVAFDGDGPLDADFFAAQNLPDPVYRLLLQCRVNAGTLHDRADFFPNYAALTPDAARFLVGRGLRVIGTDYLSIGPYYAGNTEVHHVLLGADVIIIEGLDLREVAPGPCGLVCLPLLLPADGAPCRAILLPDGVLPETLS